MKRRLEQIATAVVPDQIGRPTVALFALDTQGCLWALDGGADKGWQAVEGPPDSPPKTLPQIIKGD